MVLSRSEQLDQTEKKNGTGKKEETGADGQPLTDDEVQELRELKIRDTEVRAHEQAHLAAAGQYAAGGASFSYTTGPDGRKYASGGEVPIDIGREKTPAATIAKMRVVKRAALAPAEPSPADRQIAAQASMIESQARRELQGQDKTPKGPKPAMTNDTSDQNNEINPRRKQPLSSLSSQNVPETTSPEGYTRRIMDSTYRAISAMSA